MKKLIIIFFSISIFSCSLFDFDKERSFNSTSWENDIENRYEMSSDLISSYLYNGMSYDDVRNLLGDPDVEIYDKWEYYMGSGWDFSYYLYINYNNELVIHYYEDKETW